MMMMLYDTCNYSMLEMPIRSFTLANQHSLVCECLGRDMEGDTEEISRLDAAGQLQQATSHLARRCD